jgi:formate dehydrogenase subunit delta
MRSDKLVMMANQIARAFAVQGETRAVPQIADHIQKFWDPTMRAEIKAIAAAGSSALSPLAVKALAIVTAPEPAHTR